MFLARYEKELFNTMNVAVLRIITYLISSLLLKAEVFWYTKAEKYAERRAKHIITICN